MNRPSPELAELRTLLDALCEESITAEQLQRLEELVLSHPEAEACYVQFLSLHADLIGHFGVLSAGTDQSLSDRALAEPTKTEPGPAVAGSVNPQLTPGPRRSRLKRWGKIGLSALAAGLVLVLVPWPRLQRVPTHSGPDPEPTDRTVAVLLHAPDAKWEETGLPTRAGAPLPPGVLRLKSGLAHIEFYNGAMVILEGPAEFQLISRTEAYCARGKLRATVPPQAQGFTIKTPALDLVDRGTEFGLRVGGDKTEVHVFRGQVDLYDAGSRHDDPPRKALATGQGLRLDGPGASRLIESDTTAFRTVQELEARARAETQRLQADWAAANAEGRRDPSLVLAYTFQPEPAWSRTLRDQPGAGQQPHDGAIVGCSWVPGRWPGKQGLEFKRVSDRVRLNVPGEFESVTLATWARVDALPNRNNSLLMADGWPEGGLHWQIGDNGTIILGVKGPGPGKGPNAHYRALEAFGPERFGRWSHLAVVYDRDAGMVTHYLDGKPVAELPIQIDVPPRIGNAEIGNWNLADRRDSVPIRFFTGCIDEFLLFSRALSGHEIEQMSTRGRPPL